MVGLKISKSYLNILLLGIFLIPLLSLGYKYANGIITAKYFRFAEVVGIGSVVMWVAAWYRGFRFRLKVMDVCVFLFTLYGIGSFLWNDFLGETQTLLLVLLMGVYFICRCFGGWRVSQKTLFTFVLLIAGSVEAIWGFLQVYGLADRYHALYRLTGSFFNPGPYSGFLAVILPVALHVVLQPKPRQLAEKIVYVLGFVCLISIVLVLPAGMSRSAWLAAIVGCGVVVWRHERFRRSMELAVKRWDTRRKRWLGFGGVLLIFVVGVGLYLMKKDSADGRLLVWKMDVEVIRSEPWLGVGIGRYPGSLGKMQAAYFADGGADSREEYVADAPEYGFNEFLQMGGEFGLVGLLLFLFMLTMALVRVFRRKQQQTGGLAGAFIAFLIFACFSYPLHMLPMAMLFIVLLAWSVNVGMKGVRINRWIGQAMLLLVFGVAGVAAWQMKEKETAYKEWKTAKTYFRQGDYKGALERYTPLYPFLRDRTAYLFEFGECQSQNGRYEDAVGIFSMAAALSADPMMYNKIGRNYQVMKQYSQAETAYLRAANMIPHRLYPLYLLALLYQEMGELEKARDMARKVVEKEPKVWSPAVEEMKAEMNKLLADKMNPEK